MNPMLGLGKTLVKSSGFKASATGWTPANITTALWLDANDASTITLNGSTVSQWRDKSGNARHASQATVANQPIYTLNGLNGKPVLTFDGVDDFLRSVPISQIVQPSQYSSFVVGRAQTIDTNSNNGYENEGFYGDSSGFMSMYFRSAGLIGTYNYDGSNDVATLPYTVGNTVIGYGELSGGSIRIRVNGSSEASSVSGNVENTTGNLDIGNVYNQRRLHGTVAEVVFTRTALSTTDRQRLEGYLAWKWALEANLPSGHPYKNSPPTV